MNESIGSGSSLGSNFVTSDSTLAAGSTLGRFGNSTRGLGADFINASEAKLTAHPDDVAAFQTLLRDPIAEQPLIANELITPPADGEATNVASAASTALPKPGAAVAPKSGSTDAVSTGSQPAGSVSASVVTADIHTASAVIPRQTNSASETPQTNPAYAGSEVKPAAVTETVVPPSGAVAADIANTVVSPQSDTGAAVAPQGGSTHAVSTASQPAGEPSGGAVTAGTQTAPAQHQVASGQAPLGKLRPSETTVKQGASKQGASIAEPSALLGAVSDALVPEKFVTTERVIAADIVSTVVPPLSDTGAAVAPPQGSPIHGVNSDINMTSVQSETANSLRVDARAFASVIKDVMRTLARRDLEALNSGREITLRLDNKLVPSTTLVLRPASDQAADVSESFAPQIRVTLETESPEVAMFLRGHSATLANTLNREFPGLIRGNSVDPDFVPLSLDIVQREVPVQRSDSLPDGASDGSGAQHRDSSGDDRSGDQQNRQGHSEGEQSMIASGTRPVPDDALAQQNLDKFQTLLDG